MNLTILAFDFGMKKIGVAIGQTITTTATALEPIKAIDGIPNQIKLNQLINTWQVDYFLVGIPINMDGSKMPITYKAIKFANRLTEYYKKPSIKVDERLSTREAWHLIERKNDVHFRKKKQSIDSLVAKILLETWFENPYFPDKKK